MLRVTIDLIPHGDETKKKTIASGTISNTGTGDWVNGDYHYELEGEIFGHPSFGHEMFKGEVLKHPRHKEAWDLLYAVLKSAVQHRNEPE